MDYWGVFKFKNIYIDKLLELINFIIGWVYIFYYQVVVVIGWLFFSDFNLQNILVCSEEGCKICLVFLVFKGKKIVVCDYLQIELCIMVYLFGDKGFIYVFEYNLDIYCVIVVEVWGKIFEDVSDNECCNVKVINFGLIYGMSVFGFVKQLGILCGEVQEYIDCYFEKYFGVKCYMENICVDVVEKGYVEILFGCCFYLLEINSCNGQCCQVVECIVINVLM